jgi:phosphoglycerate dehydrogenase-like enzyme
MPTVLIAPAPLRHQPGPYRDLLVAAGFVPIDPDGDGTLTEAQLRAYLPLADAMLAGGEELTAAVLADAPRLRVIARTGVGYDSVDVDAATRQGIPVAITPGTNQGSVAEQAFALLLAVARNVHGNDATIRRGGWDRTLVRPLRGSTLGLLGLGRIGRAVATRALAFEMRVLACDPLPPGPFEAQHGIERVPMETILREADVLSLHLPLTAETRGLIRAGTLARMKPGAILINTARGGLVVERDLHDALVSGHLAGAGLDVLQEEPPAPDHPLLRLPNCVFSPHIGGIDAKGMADMAELAARCVVDLHQGRWPADCVVNAELAPGWAWK